MERTLLLLPAIACLSLSVFAQVPVDKTVSLQSVEIQGKRFGGLTGGEVKRLQVDSNLSGLTGTTADVFRLLPSVVTDIEGGITFRGSNNPGLLINGVPYGLLEEYSGDMLIQLPALFFDRVSMTSTPSIGLVPDGDAGILNLSSAVYTAADSPLVLTLGAGFQERYNAGAILNLHPGKFHIVGKYNYRREFHPEEIESKLNNLPFVMESIIIEKNGKLVGLVYPDYDTVDSTGISHEDLPIIMEQNRIELNKLLAPYEAVSALQLYPTEFEKTPKKSIKRYLYSNY